VAGIADAVIREPGAESVEQYAQRVRRLALSYTILFITSIIGMILLVWKGQFFVTLAQRSNIETLTLAFFIVLFGYVAVLSGPGTLGAFRIAYFAVLRMSGRDPVEVERAKMRHLGTVDDPPPAGALNAMVERAGAPGDVVRVTIGDEAGVSGELVFEGAELRHEERRGAGSNGVLAFTVHQVNQLMKRRGEPATLEIVSWKSIDDEAAEQYLGLVRFARNLERHLGADELWPKVRLTDRDCDELERRLRALCPIIRDEAFLPDWEFSAEHKIPIIPEPLGLVTLSRTEQRADPLATMGCAVMVVVVLVTIIGLMIVFPPWVPGS
jgi:hypothetical protein